MANERVGNGQANNPQLEKREARGRALSEVMCAAAARREQCDAKGEERRSEMREARRTRGARRSAAERRRKTCRHGEEPCAAAERKRRIVGNDRANNRLQTHEAERRIGVIAVISYS